MMRLSYAIILCNLIPINAFSLVIKVYLKNYIFLPTPKTILMVICKMVIQKIRCVEPR